MIQKSTNNNDSISIRKQVKKKKYKQQIRYKIQMQRTFSFQNNNHQFPTLQSIDAQSQIQIDYQKQQTQQLITKILMLCLELEHKHKITQQLQLEVEKDQLKKSQIDITYRDLNCRYQKLLKQHHLLIQNHGIIKSNMVNMEKIIADLEIHKTRSAYNKQLQDRVTGLEIKLKQAEQEKIQYLQRQKNLKRENSMLSYSANKTTQKNRIRDLQLQLTHEKSKLQAERKITIQLKSQLQKNVSEMKILKESQIVSVKKWEQKIQSIQMIRQSEDLKQQQAVAASEQKIVLLSQQLHRLSGEIDYLRNLLKEQKNKFSDKDTQIKKLTADMKLLQEQRKSSHKNFTTSHEQSRRRQQQLVTQIEILQKSIKNLQLSHIDLQQFLKQKTGKEGQLNGQVQRLRQQLDSVDNERNTLKTQLRKLKRKQILNISAQCQLCKMRVAVPNNRAQADKMRQVDLSQIIKQTEKLNASNKKIQNLINHHSIITQHSLQIRSNATASIINMSNQL